MDEITWKEAFLISLGVFFLLLILHVLYLFVRYCYIRFRGYAVNAVNEASQKHTVEILKKNCTDEVKRSAPLLIVGFCTLAVGIHLSSRYLSDYNPSTSADKLLTTKEPEQLFEPSVRKPKHFETENISIVENTDFPQLHREIDEAELTQLPSQFDDHKEAVLDESLDLSQWTTESVREVIKEVLATPSPKEETFHEPLVETAECGVIFFYHINKCGGLTVSTAVKARIGAQNYMQFFANSGLWQQNRLKAEPFLQFNGKKLWKALEIHNGFPGLHYIQEDLAKWKRIVTDQGCVFKKVTVLRNPLERLISNLKWNHVDTKNDKQGVWAWIESRRDWQSRYLLYNICNEKLECHWNKSTADVNTPSLTDEAFNLLVQMLKDFAVVGVTERLHDFIHRLVGEVVVAHHIEDKHVQSYDDYEIPISVDEIPAIVRMNVYDYTLYYTFAPLTLPISIEDASEMTMGKLMRYYLLNKPCLIRNASQHLFHNYKDFSEEYIRKNLDPTMRLWASVNSGRLLVSDYETTLPECMDSNERCVYFQKVSFRRSNGEITANDHDELRQSLFRGMKEDTFAWKGDLNGKYDIYISKHGGALPHAHGQRFNHVFEGQKRWVLVPPEAYPSMEYQVEFELSKETGAGKRWKEYRAKHNMPEWSTYKNTQWFEDYVNVGKVNLTHYDFIQEAGDMFFLPSYVTHGTMDVTPLTIGIILRGQATQLGTSGLDFPHFDTATIILDE